MLSFLTAILNGEPATQYSSFLDIFSKYRKHMYLLEYKNTGAPYLNLSLNIYTISLHTDYPQRLELCDKERPF